MKPSFFALFIIISILFLNQISFSAAQNGEIEKGFAHAAEDPRGLGGILKRFVLRTLGKALSKAAETLRDECPEAYAKMVSHVGDATEALHNGQIANAIFGVVAAINDLFNCYHRVIVVGILKVALAVLKLLK